MWKLAGKRSEACQCESIHSQMAGSRQLRITKSNGAEPIQREITEPAEIANAKGLIVLDSALIVATEQPVLSSADRFSDQPFTSL